MASSYSTNLKIELQATGENSGTWGTITNTNLGTALEQAIVGYGNPNYASDANLTLTYTDTNAAQAARALVLNVTSTGSLTATRELVVPTIQKQYIVQNNTTGSQSITVKTSAGTGITVPNGRKAHLYVDGTNVIYMDDYVDINGGAIDGTPIGASSASTGAFTTATATTGNITTVNATTVDTTNIEVTNIKAKDGTAAGSIADSTGVVTLASSVLTTTDINGGTIDGTTIGGSTAAAGTFTSLSSSAASTFNGGVVINEPGADADTRIEGDTDANLFFADASTDRIGIGTNAPDSKLSVVKNAAEADLLVWSPSASTGDRAALYLSATAGSPLTRAAAIKAEIGSSNNHSLAFFTNPDFAVPVERARITSDGNFGIGTTSPAARLHVDGSGIIVADSSNTGSQVVIGVGTLTAGRPFVGTATATNPMEIGTRAAEFLAFVTNSTERARITSGGLFQVGTTTTPASGEIKQVLADAGSLYLQMTRTSTTVGGVVLGTNGSAFQFFTHTGGVGSETYTERARITSDGKFGIGTTSPALLLTVEKSDGSGRQNLARFLAGGNTTNNGASIIVGSTQTECGYITGLQTASNEGTLVFGVQSSGAYAERARITSGGDFGIGTSSPALRLDVRGGSVNICASNADGANAPAYRNSGDGNNDLFICGNWSGSQSEVDLVASNEAGDGIRLYQAKSTFAARQLLASFGKSVTSFFTDGSERARITAGGYSKFSNDGTYVGSTGAYHEFRQSANEANLIVQCTGSSLTQTAQGVQVNYSNAAPNNTTAAFLYCNDTGGQRAAIRSNGGLANYQTNNVDLSDARTKNSITPAASMWGKVSALEIVTYKYNDQTHDDVNLGVIAQQVESVEPVWVDNDGFGKTPEGEEPLKTVYTKDIYFAAIKALQEAMARIEKLEAEVAAMKGA